MSISGTVISDVPETLPFQLVAHEDRKGTEYYVSEATGSVFLRTTSRSRFLAWCGAIPHWR